MEDISIGSKKKSVFREYAEALLWALGLALIIRTLFLQAFTIPSGSMLQTVQIGDIIVFKYPKDTSIDYIKRVVGVPGDVVEMRNKQFYRNGQPVKEDYIQQLHPGHIGPLDNTRPVTVPPDYFFVMGDNRDNSLDSREWGLVPRGYIHGKAWRLYWSWDSSIHRPRIGRIGQLVK